VYFDRQVLICWDKAAASILTVEEFLSNINAWLLNCILSSEEEEREKIFVPN
jgi:hypothetical protein